MLHSKWKYDYACAKREMKYIAKISTLSAPSQYIISLNDYLTIAQKEL